MPKDFLSKQPTKFERLETKTSYHLDRIYRILEDFDTRLTALSRAKVEPEVLAKFMLESKENKKYSTDLTTAVEAKIAEADQELIGKDETMAEEQVDQQAPVTEGAEAPTAAPEAAPEAPAEAAPSQEETPAV